MREAQKNLESVKELLKDQLPRYLASMGITDPYKQFRCINPEHNDTNPSCGLVKASDHRIFHCFSCQVVGDIFTAAGFLEGKPMTGRGFVQENLLHLASLFGIDVPELPELTEEDIAEMEAYSACLHAAMIVKASPRSELVQRKLEQLKWDDQTLQRIGVGTVSSHEDYLQRMTGHYKHPLEFLKKIGLDDKRIFHESSLIYVIRDEHGAPVGFQARDLNYEKKQARYDHRAAEIRTDEKLTGAEREKALEELKKPPKYINTGDRLFIYQKGKRLFNLDLAKKHAPPLYVFEGNPDCVTAVAGGLQNAVAICATYFTKEHLELVLSCGIKHIVFALDADAAGDIGTDSFVKLLQDSLPGHVGLRADIIVMPEGTDDPDNYIRSFGDLRRGVQEFRRLPTSDIFSWTLRKRVREGADPMTLAEEVVPLIVNEANNLIRMTMTKKLAQETGLDESGLWREVLRQVDVDRMGAEEEKIQIARKASKDLAQNPSHAQMILERARIQIETVEKRKSGYDPRNVINAVRHQFERAEKMTRSIELVTGYPAFDRAFGGVPYCDVFMSFPGKPNHSKTSFLQNLAWHLVENNKDCRVLLHTMDDALSAAIPRIQASRAKSEMVRNGMPTRECPTDWFKRAGFYREHVQDFDRIYGETKRWLDHLVEEEQLIIADVSILAPALASLEVWVRNIRSKFPNDALVVMGDNFVQYDLPGYEGERLDREKSKTIKRIANEYHVTMMITCELPKGSLRPGLRPRMANIKGTSGIAYDVNANVGVYNDLKDMREAATLYWEGATEEVLGPNGERQLMAKKMPIVELVIDKSKISSFDGSIFYRLDPDSGYMEECDENEQNRLREKAAQSVGRPEENSSYVRNQSPF